MEHLGSQHDRGFSCAEPELLGLNADIFRIGCRKKTVRKELFTEVPIPGRLHRDLCHITALNPHHTLRRRYWSLAFKAGTTTQGLR